VIRHRGVAPVRRRSHMRRDPLAAMEHLDGARRDPRPHRLAQQRVRHRVVMPLDFDVVIEADPAFLPFRVEVGLDRQRLEGGALDLVEQRAPAGERATSASPAEVIDTTEARPCNLGSARPRRRV
jgi:hypothetical protein